MAQPEKLSLWDRWFNRYRRTVHKRGQETWCKSFHGMDIPNTDYQRNWVDYLVVDRVTGSETIERDYLN